MSFIRHPSYFLLVTAAILLAGFAVFIYQGAHTSLEAERTLGAYILVVDVLTDFVQENGTWPKSWEELQRSSGGREVEGYRWPDSADEIRERVRVNFDLTRDDVARMDERDFSAVEQIGPNYGQDETRVRQLLKALKEN